MAQPRFGLYVPQLSYVSRDAQTQTVGLDLLLLV